jgi:hypothetical protein
VGHPPAVFARYPWLKPQFNQAAFRGLKAPAPSGKTGAGAKEEADSSGMTNKRGCGMANREQATAREEICGRKGWRVEAGASSSGSFALERRAQDDKQRQKQIPFGNDKQKDKYRDPSLRSG